MAKPKSDSFRAFRQRIGRSFTTQTVDVECFDGLRDNGRPTFRRCQTILKQVQH